MAPSPNSNITLNTPGNQSQPTPSPCSNDEQAYRDKVKQLSRYIEPLRKMISRLGNGGSPSLLFTCFEPDFAFNFFLNLQTAKKWVK